MNYKGYTIGKEINNIFMQILFPKNFAINFWRDNIISNN